MQVTAKSRVRALGQANSFDAMHPKTLSLVLVNVATLLTWSLFYASNACSIYRQVYQSPLYSVSDHDWHDRQGSNLVPTGNTSERMASFT